MASLEFAVPTNRFWRWWWWIYTRVVLPVAGAGLGGRAWFDVGRFLGPSINDLYRRFPVAATKDAWEAAGLHRCPNAADEPWRRIGDVGSRQTESATARSRHERGHPEAPAPSFYPIRTASTPRPTGGCCSIRRTRCGICRMSRSGPRSRRSWMAERGRDAARLLPRGRARPRTRSTSSRAGHLYTDPRLGCWAPLPPPSLLAAVGLGIVGIVHIGTGSRGVHRRRRHAELRVQPRTARRPAAQRRRVRSRGVLSLC